MRHLLLPAILTVLPLVAYAQSPRAAAHKSFMATAVRVGTIPRKAAPTIGAARAIVVDYNSGRVLYEKNARQRCAVASTQKLMTALCVMDNGNLSKRFSIVKSDTWVVPTKLGILPGEVYSRRSLLGALLVKSGNDVARALARSVSGSETSFAKLMNRKARSLGMHHSHFLNPHGLTATGQYSTARDMAICARAAYRSSTLRGIIKTKAYTFNYSNGRKKRLTNTNRILKKLSYCTGMKTGTTKASGRCLISSGSLNGRTAIVVVLGATSSTVWKDSENLLRWSLERPAAL
ncbi:MAG: D-alanyl-D-alanine carboxypeptidase [Verrucomicrobiae bacterium]|nr:D-alanyl-D-alanine carboxypeptidase [Verrucomicrobiae bacterium]NNJ43428.1 D-alanyl-D-alanine carboxypeptidase [Akkermansiaceae bacterium]